VPTSFCSSLLRQLKAPFRTSRPDDGRGHRFVAVIDCILNQNVRDAGAAEYPAMNFAVLELCHEHAVGILQMPCPEIAALGFPRTRPVGQTIRQVLDSDNGHRTCAALAVGVADRIASQLAAGDRLLAILGGNPRSPGCAVHGEGNGVHADSGVFIQELQRELGRRGLTPPFRGIRDASPELLAEDLLWLHQLISQE
jgi:predicted secreted protein